MDSPPADDAGSGGIMAIVACCELIRRPERRRLGMMQSAGFRCEPCHRDRTESHKHGDAE
jgi:hypothetical protein